MDDDYIRNLFSLRGRVAVVTGGGGILCGAMGKALGRAGARVAVLDLSLEAARGVVAQIQAEGGEAVPIECDVLEKAAIEAGANQVLDSFGRVDILVNGAGGNKPQATTGPQQAFFDLPAEAVQWVFNLNVLSALLCSQVFGRLIAQGGEGVILNISSMNALRPLTRIPAYSAAKAAVSNFTQWLAVHMAQEYSPRIRVNAIAPGFFLTEQNRFLLLEEKTGRQTARGQAILSHTPMGRFGDPADLLGTVLWLLSPASSFVTGVVVPVDGGFSACSGV